LAYSPKKKRANPIQHSSPFWPETNSASLFGKSNGGVGGAPHLTPPINSKNLVRLLLEKKKKKKKTDIL
jgi:hypothetical protein